MCAWSRSMRMRPPRPYPCCRLQSSRSTNSMSTATPAGMPESSATRASPCDSPAVEKRNMAIRRVIVADSVGIWHSGDSASFSRRLRFDHQLFLHKCLVFHAAARQSERTSQLGPAILDAGYDVGAAQPVRLLEIGWRPARGMIGMSVVKANNVEPACARVTLDMHQFARIDFIAVLRRVGPRVAAAHARAHDAGVTIDPT